MKKYICESCNKDFDTPDKINKFFAVIGLLFIYIVLSFLIIPFAIVLSFFIVPFASLLWIIALIHIISIIVKDNKRGKCPNCGSIDFVYIESVKGQVLLKKIKKIKKEIES